VNPILRKELRSLLRERRGWLVPVVYAAVLAAAVYLFYLPAALVESEVDMSSYLGPVFAGVVAVLQTFAIVILAPLVGAAGIAGERERGTFTRLLASPVSRSGIGLGKAAAGSIYVVFVLCVSLPVAALSMLFGGTDLNVLAGLYATQLLLGLTLVCLGLLVSTAFQRTWTAALVAIAIALGLFVFTAALSAAVGGKTAFGRHIVDFSPGYGLYLFFAGDMDAARRGGWVGHYLALSTLAVGSLALTLVRLRSLRD
jgi:ABC-type transport system involved in multi-copper enzyme maturation permease subunit